MFTRTLLTLVVVAACSAAGAAEPGGRPTVVATLFPQYDFARRIGGDRARVSMLLPPGADSHSYEPTPSDMVGIAKADLFIHAGPEMEPWAGRILAAVAGSGGVVGVDSSRGIELIRVGAAEEGHAGDDGHGHAVDPHFWLDPRLAMTMAETIAEAMAAADPANADYYGKNFASLLGDLRKLDADCRAMTIGARRRVLVFGGRFAFAYFFKRYGLEQVGVYDGCGPGVEPSLKRIAEVTAYVRDNHVQVVYHEEFVEPRVAKTIAAETGASLAMVHSLHTVSADEAKENLTYLDLMRRNLAAFRKGLE